MGKHRVSYSNKLEKYQKLYDLNYTNKKDNYYSFLTFMLEQVPIVNANQKETLNKLKEIFENKKGHTLKVLIDQRYRNLQKLLESYTNPINIHSKYNYVEDRLKVTIRASSMRLSEILDKMASRIKRKLKPGDEFRLIASNRIFLDVDMKKEQFSGVNVTLVGPSFELAGPEVTRFTLETDGLNAQKHEKRQAKSGENGVTDEDGCGTNGEKGSDGLNGLPGGHAGNIFIFADVLPDNDKIYLSARGGNGSNGQIGGNGGRGGIGANGINGTEREARYNMRYQLADDLFHIGFFIYYSGFAWDIGSPGNSGGNGGSSGYSGRGGQEGKAGTITVKKKRLHNIIQLDGVKGDDGNWEEAKPGVAGKHGQNGTTVVMKANQLERDDVMKSDYDKATFYECRCYDVNKIRKNCHMDDPAHRSNQYGFIYMHKVDMGWFTLSSEPRVVTDNLDSDEGRYASNEIDGEQNRVKSTSNEQSTAKRVNSINEHDVFAQTNAFLSNLCQQDSEHYQSWNSDMLAKFMNSFSAEIGRNEHYNESKAAAVEESSASIRAKILNRAKEVTAQINTERSSETNLSKGLTTQFSAQIAKELEKALETRRETEKKVQTENERKIIVDNQKTGVQGIESKSLKIVKNNEKPIKIKEEKEFSIRKEFTSLKNQYLHGSNLYLLINSLKINGFEKTRSSKIVNYEGRIFQTCLNKIKSDERYLNLMNDGENFKNIKTHELVSVLYDYSILNSPELRVEEILTNFPGFNRKEISRLACTIFESLESDDKESATKDAHLLAHKILLTDCLDCIQPVIDLVKKDEIKRIISWLSSFYNIEHAHRVIRGFKGTNSEFQTRLIMALIVDSFDNCYPSLQGMLKRHKSKIETIHYDLLSIFYNKLQNDYKDENIKSSYIMSRVGDENSTIRRLDSSYIETLLVRLSEINLKEHEINEFDVKRILSVQSLKSWTSVFDEIEFSKNFSIFLGKARVDLSDKNAKACLRLLNYFRKLLKSDDFSRLFSPQTDISLNYGDIKQDPLQPWYTLLVSLRNLKIDLDQALDIKKNFKYDRWIDEIKRRIKENKLYVAPKQRSIEDIVKSLQKINPGRSYAHFKGALDDIFNKINSKIKEIESKSSEKIQLVKNWIEKFDSASINERIAILSAAWFVANNQTPKKTQLTAILLFIDYKSRNESLLEQINTGEGKTLTVGLLSAYLALCGSNVDVLSSNRDLAMDGEKKCASFFTLVGVSSAHNCHHESDDRKKAYTSPIVYGDVASFQGDRLESEFSSSRKNIVGDRYTDMSKCYLVVDEVDSMCLDKAKDVLYLSHSIDGLKWLETVFIYIWVSVLKETPQSEHQLKVKVKEIVDGVNELAKSKAVFVPEHLLEYVEQKLQVWTESAFQAKGMEANDEFVIDKPSSSSSSTSRQKKIIVLDKDVGVEQYTSRWSNGLAQFLELKYRRKISIESLKAVFMSNKKFFELYGSRLFGLTGTLGADISKKFLNNIYKTNFIIMPTAFPKQYYNEPALVASTKREWLQLIALATREHSSHRPVLIITETVQNAEEIINHLKLEGISQNKIRSYMRDFDEVEKHFEASPASSGDIVVATNKGGRGTDIKVSEASNQEGGGLHVILTYLPSNERIEAQAFGRTSRNGNPGSGQFILLIEDDEEIVDELLNLSAEQRLARLEELGESILEKKKEERNRASEKFLNDMMDIGIMHLDIEQNLFDEFKLVSRPIITNCQQLINRYIEDVLNNKSCDRSIANISWNGKETVDVFGLLSFVFDEIGDYEYFKQDADTLDEFIKKIKEKIVDSIFKEELEQFVLNMLKDSWAFWLDSVQSRIKESTSMSIQSVLCQELRKEFQPLIDHADSFRSSSDIASNLLKLTKFPEQQITLGHLFLRHGSKERARVCYESAAKCDPSGSAYIHLAYCEIPYKKGSSETDMTIKKKVRRHLKKAKIQLSKMLNVLQTNKVLGDNVAKMTMSIPSISQFVSPQDNHYCEQLESKMKVLDVHLSIINKAIGSSLHDENVFAEGNEQEFAKSQEIYYEFVRNHILHHNRVRREFVNVSLVPGDCGELSTRGVNLIRNAFDKSISEPVIQVLNKNKNINSNHIEKKQFEDVMRDRDYFWSLLERSAIKPREHCQTVQVLDIDKALKKLTEEYKDTYDELIGKCQIRLVNIEEKQSVDLIKSTAKYDKEILLIRLTHQTSVYLKNKGRLYQLVDRWSVEELDRERMPPKKESMESNKIYFARNNDKLMYAYKSSRIDSKIQSDEIEISSEDGEINNEWIFENVLDEPLIGLSYDQDEILEYTPGTGSSSSEFSALIDDALKRKGVKLDDRLNESNVLDSLFVGDEKKLALKQTWVNEKLLNRQKRIYLPPSIREIFIERLKNTIKNEPTTINEIYSNISLKNKKDGIFDYLRELMVEKEKCDNEQIRDYLYVSEIPFMSREKEADSVIKVLHELKILKSGGLSLKWASDINEGKYAYNKLKDNLEKRFDESSICNTYLGQIVDLQGDIRSYRDGLKGYFQTFTELDTSVSGSRDKNGLIVSVPEELGFYESFGLDRYLTLEQDKRFHMNWAAFAVTILGILQIAGGIALCCIGMPTFGNALISEGVSDVIQGVMGMITGQFSLSDWAMQKAVSLAISLITAGISAAKVATTVGTLTKAQIFTKAIIRVGVDLAGAAVGEAISHFVISPIMASTQESITKAIKPIIKAGFEEQAKEMKQKLKAIRKKHGNVAYRQAVHEFQKNMEIISRDRTLAKTISAIQTIRRHIETISRALDSGGGGSGAKGKAVSALKKFAKKQATDLIENSLKLTEVPKLILAMKIYMELTSRSLQAKLDAQTLTTSNQENELSPEEEAQSDADLDRLINTLSNRVSSDICDVLSGAVNGAVKSGLAMATNALNKKIEAKLDAKFAQKNSKKAAAKTQQQQEVLKDKENKASQQSEADKAKEIETNVVNPKNNSSKNSELGMAEAKMLAEKDGRVIYVHDKESGEVHRVTPISLEKRLVALFRQSGEIKFENGHFVNARAPERFVEENDGNNCLLIAYHESLGHNVNQTFINERRRSLDTFIEHNPHLYDMAKEEARRNNWEHIRGGGQLPKNRQKVRPTTDTNTDTNTNTSASRILGKKTDIDAKDLDADELLNEIKKMKTDKELVIDCKNQKQAIEIAEKIIKENDRLLKTENRNVTYEPIIGKFGEYAEKVVGFQITSVLKDGDTNQNPEEIMIVRLDTDEYTNQTKMRHVNVEYKGKGGHTTLALFYEDRDIKVKGKKPEPESVIFVRDLDAEYKRNINNNYYPNNAAKEIYYSIRRIMKKKD